MPKININMPIGAGLALIIVSALAIIFFASYWLWGIAGLCLGIACLTGESFKDIAKWLFIISLIAFLLAIIFQRD